MGGSSPRASRGEKPRGNSHQRFAAYRDSKPEASSSKFGFQINAPRELASTAQISGLDATPDLDQHGFVSWRLRPYPFGGQETPSVANGKSITLWLRDVYQSSRIATLAF
jgi:hypothetical protein